ncbi:MAG: hypothetical protein HZRFUVUK_001618 [Candidatus Fervidibacterota bacterium]|jgi:hypothetical protein
MGAKMNRRSFLKAVTYGGVGLVILKDSKSVWSYQANEKLNMAFIGCGGQGGGLLNTFAGMGNNVVALCDVDEQRAADAFKKFPDAKKYNDFRKMLEEMKDQIDAVVVATPDHTHACASVMAMKFGKHVYCEKPLTWCIYEARVMRQVAMENKVATQMGNQGTGAHGFRQGVEVIRSGVLGKVTEVHVWTNRPIWPQGMDRPKDTPPVPPHLHWDLWLGPAPWRPYHPDYLPFKWRGWVDFGTGAIGDMACHNMNLAVMGLRLHEYIAEGLPITVEAEHSGFNKESYPKWSIIRYEFPQRGDQPPIKFIWYDGGKMPPQDLLPDVKLPDNGTIIVGEKGKLFSPGYGGSWELYPKEEFKDYKPPEPTLPRSPGHHREWVDACKGGPTPMSNFVDYAAYLTEIALLGNLAIFAGRKIEYDPKEMKVKDCPELEPYIKRPYREGWTL